MFAVEDEPEAPIVLACFLIVTGIALLLSGIIAFGFHRNSLHSMALLWPDPAAGRTGKATSSNEGGSDTHGFVFG
jgi:hypothetical protein